MILAQWMYVFFSLLVFKKNIAGFRQKIVGLLRGDIVATVVAIDAATAETTACMLFVLFFCFV